MPEMLGDRSTPFANGMALGVPVPQLVIIMCPNKEINPSDTPVQEPKAPTRGHQANSQNVSELHLLGLSERALRKWSTNSINITVLFTEYPDTTFTLVEIYRAIRNWHLERSLTMFSEQAIRSVLWRFSKNQWLNVRRIGNSPLYKVTEYGLKVLWAARHFFEKDADQSSHTRGDLGQLPRSSSHTGVSLVDLVLTEWDEYFDWNDAWFEKSELKFIIDQYIAEKIELSCEKRAKKRVPGRHHEESYKINVYPTTGTVRLFPKRPSSIKILGNWLEKDVGLGHSDLRLFFASLRQAAKSSNVVIEAPTKFPINDHETFFLGMGIRRQGRMGKVPEKSATSRDRGRRDNGCCNGLHQFVWSHCNCNMAEVFRVQRRTGEHSYSGHEPYREIRNSSREVGKTERIADLLSGETS